MCNNFVEERQSSAAGRSAQDERRQSDGREGLLVVGPLIPLGAGHYEIAERLRLDQPASRLSASALAEWVLSKTP